MNEEDEGQQRKVGELVALNEEKEVRDERG